MTAKRASLSPATQLLLLAAAPQPQESAMRRLLSAGVDWDEMCVLAQHERAASIVLRKLGQLVPAPPDSGYGDLRQLAAVSVMRMLHLEQLLFRTLDGLAGQGIQPMVFKGAGLAYTVYPSFADRPMSDLDILVPPRRAQEAWEFLQTQGWTWPSTIWGAERYTTHQHLPPLVQEPGAFRLEIHSDVLPGGHPFGYGAETFWGRARQVHVNGRVLTIPHPVHQLLNVCVHFAWQHGMQWGAWRALRDVGAIIQRNTSWDWPEFVALARESRAGTCCYWTLRLAHRLAGAAVPEDVLAALRPPRREFMLERLERHYVLNLFPFWNRCPSVWLRQRLWAAGILPRWSGHGTARPWDVARRWMEGGVERESERRRPAPLWVRLGNLPAWWIYLRRLHGFVLPAHLQPYH